MSCKKCITNQVWGEALPPDLLKKCENCNKIGLPLTDLLKTSGAISVFIYIISFFLSLLSN